MTLRKTGLPSVWMCFEIARVKLDTKLRAAEVTTVICHITKQQGAHARPQSLTIKNSEDCLVLPSRTMPTWQPKLKPISVDPETIPLISLEVHLWRKGGMSNHCCRLVSKSCPFWAFTIRARQSIILLYFYWCFFLTSIKGNTQALRVSMWGEGVFASAIIHQPFINDLLTKPHGPI